MSHLPVIVSFGGVSPAGRSSCHYGYRRLVFDALSREDQDRTLQNLAVLTGNLKQYHGVWLDKNQSPVELKQFLQQHKQGLLDGTLIRKLESNLFEPTQLLMQSPVTLESPENGGALRFHLPLRKMPAVLPETWT